MLAGSYFKYARKKKWVLLKIIMWAGGALLFFFAVSSTTGKLSKQSYLQTKYACSAGKCTQAKFVKNVLENATFDSIELCRLLCQKYGTLWPLPTMIANMSQQVVEIDPNNIEVTYFTPDSATELFLKKTVNIFTKTLITECQGKPSTKPERLFKIGIRITSSGLDLDLKTEESYKIFVTTKNKGLVNVEINATTVYGARHGLETLLQLTGRHVISDLCSTLIVDTATIKDRPIFKYRGVLLDSSRNFLPVDTIKNVLSAMSSVKMNVLHWHITDSHSFPLYLTKLPLLSKYGAYSSQEIYTPEDVNNLVDYAKLRGIRIVMEIDAPAHAGNGWEFGEEVGLGKLVVCLNSEPWRDYCVQPPCGQLNPANPNLYFTLHNLYEELQSLIPAKDLFHMGGDEVHIPCWNASTEITDYMTAQGIPRTKEGFFTLWSDFQKKALEAWDEAVGHNKTTPILWSSQLTEIEYIEKYLDKNRYIIETWTGRYESLPEDLMAKGYSVIYATKDTWYLDHGFWGNTQYHTWKTVYDYIIPEDPKALGGEVLLWGELVDMDNVETKLWPRAAAIAERLWTSPQLTSNQVESRLWETRQRLRRRGHKIDQVIPEWCYLNDGKCPYI
ncbi:beta-hexosaminidase 2 isoform X2 [Rhodnius prolixus]|uniref:beta-hexosaminidase 2 isoform X2 n=2 Tax=Rhodnius prolixus TaxID=13249 RepID=UPI003D18942D